jgi:uncharacterized protein YacL
MTPKQTALIRVSTVLLAGVMIAVLLNAVLTIFTFSQVGLAIAVAMLVYMIKVFYDFEVSKAENLDKKY